MDSFIETDQVLDDNASTYEADAPTKEQKLRFTGYKLKLIDLGTKMDKPTGWLTKQKTDAKNGMLAKLFPLSNALVCFANNKSDDLMLANVKLSKSEQKELSDTDLLAYSKQVIDIARENLCDPPIPNITEETVVALETDRNAFQQKRIDRDMLFEDKAVDKAEFNCLRVEMNRLLCDELDPSIENYRLTHPEFVAHYFKARQLTKTPHHANDVLGYVIDEISGEPVAYGKVTLEGLDLSTEITEKGTFRFKSFPVGKNTLIIENIDYQTQRVSVSRYAPEHCKLNIKMVTLPVEKTEMV